MKSFSALQNKQLEETLNTLTLIVDTREHDTIELQQRVRQTGLPFVREKLDYGDYSARISTDGGSINLSARFAIERKMSLDELALCLTSERERFVAEFERAWQNKARLYLLIENGSFERINQGAYRSHMNPAAYMASVFAFMARYDCQVLFCTPNLTGRVIREIVIRETKEFLREFLRGLDKEAKI